MGLGVVCVQETEGQIEIRISTHVRYHISITRALYQLNDGCSRLQLLSVAETLDIMQSNSNYT